jgi:hypothetical protein
MRLRIKSKSFQNRKPDKLRQAQRENVTDNDKR